MHTLVKVFFSYFTFYILDQSRRDDLESVGYILLYFYLGGKLPWDNVQKSNRYEENENIKMMKCKLFDNNNNFSQILSIIIY